MENPSLTNRIWVFPDAETERQGLAIAQRHGLPEIIGRVLAGRDIEINDVPMHLAPTMRDLLPDPSALKDMDIAAERLVSALRAGERIALFSDYDVDGAGSAALLLRWLRALGHDATIYIPDRIDEGYGPNVEAMERLAQDHSLILCLDCGTLSHEPIAAAVGAGADVVILDHHLAGETLPDCTAIVNPNRQDEDGSLAQLCAAGVVFLLLVAANRVLRPDFLGHAEPKLLALLDLVALATVADVAPLRGVNRAFVRQGLEVMRQRQNLGIVALSDVSKMNTAPSAFHLGFMLGPRVNAGGRVGRADRGTALLSTDNPAEAQKIARELDALNKERREIEAHVLEEAMAQVEVRIKAKGETGGLVWAAGEGWHPGVVGIVASRLKDQWHRPAIVIGLSDGVGKGSGRSITGVDLGRSIQGCVREGLLEKGGGHKMAAGLTVAEDKLHEAMNWLDIALTKQGAADSGARSLKLDGVLSLRGASMHLAELLEKAGPFGAGAPAPRFAFQGVTLMRAREVGSGHLSATLTDGSWRLDAIAFRAFQSELGPALANAGQKRVDVAGRIQIDSWQGRQRVKLHLEDARFSE